MNRKKTVRRLKKAFASSRKKATRSLEKAIKASARGMKAGGKKLKEAERSGALDKWKTRVGLGLRALEVAAVAAAAYKGATVKVGNPRRAPAKRTARKAAAKRKTAR